MQENEDRAVATQIDFLVATVIIIAAISIYYVGSVILFETQTYVGEGDAQAGLNAEKRLAEDVLLNQSGDTLLDPECSRAFFNAEDEPTCKISDPGDGQTYLRGVLGLGDRYEINVTLTNATGIVDFDPSGGSNPFEHSIGNPYPRDGEVTTYQRTVSYGTDYSGDGKPEYYTLTIRIW